MDKIKAITWTVVMVGTIANAALIFWGASKIINFLNGVDFFEGCGCALVQFAAVALLIWAAAQIGKSWNQSKTS